MASEFPQSTSASVAEHYRALLAVSEAINSNRDLDNVLRRFVNAHRVVADGLRHAGRLSQRRADRH